MSESIRSSAVYTVVVTKIDSNIVVMYVAVVDGVAAVDVQIRTCRHTIGASDVVVAYITVVGTVNIVIVVVVLN